jgi:hypothetical protein
MTAVELSLTAAFAIVGIICSVTSRVAHYEQ